MPVILSNRKLPVNSWYKLSIVLLMGATITLHLPSGIRQPFLIIKTIIAIILFLWGINKHSLKNSMSATLPIIAYGALMVFSAFYNHTSTSVKLQSISNMLLFIDMFLVSNRFLEKYDITLLCRLLVKILLVYIVINDLTVLVIPAKGLVRYFVGTKFMVSYTHWFFCGLLLFSGEQKRTQGRKWLCILAVVESALIIAKVQCSTGLVGLAFIVFIAVFSELKIVKKVFAPRNVPLAIAIFTGAFLLLEEILRIGFISNFIVNVLGESLTLTGRLKIYSNLGAIVSRSPWFGFGYENKEIMNVVGYGNAQNGLWELIINYGIIGAGAFIVSVIMSCRKVKMLDHYTIPFAAMMFSLAFASIVEISFNNYFILMLAITFAIGRHTQCREAIE